MHTMRRVKDAITNEVIKGLWEVGRRHLNYEEFVVMFRPLPLQTALELTNMLNGGLTSLDPDELEEVERAAVD